MESINVINKIRLELSNEESLVLFSWLFRFNTTSGNSIFFEDQAEERVLWDLEAVLEKAIPEILSRDYEEVLSKARQKIRD